MEGAFASKGRLRAEVASGFSSVPAGIGWGLMTNDPDPDRRALLSAIGDWPYAEDELMRLLSPELIESHASAQLSRALNIGRLIAVVGSGVTNAYGKPTWARLLRNYLFELRDEA